MTAASVSEGNTPAGWIVWTPLPGIAKAIVSTVGGASPAAHSPLRAPEGRVVDAAVIASRSVHWPSSSATSAVLFTRIVAAGAAVQNAAAIAAVHPKRVV